MDEAAFYRSLLMLGAHNEPGPMLDEALASLVATTDAREAWVEVRDLDGEGERWSAAVGCDGERVEEIRATVSRGIIAATLASGETVVTADATLDPKYRDLKSVQLNKIESVICTPIGPVGFGVVYLRAKRIFDVAAREMIELFAAALAPIAERLIAETRPVDVATKLPGVIGRSDAMRELTTQLEMAGSLDVTLLFSGPSGTGKTMLASAVHAISHRSGGPFVEVNCAAIPDSLLESELFGAVAGAYTDAKQARKGRVEAAAGGTLFLDEVGELSPAAQAKLLQLLQSGTYYALGSTEPRRADIRVIAATNVDLERAVRDGAFREDLYYRLKVLAFAVPPLSERVVDIVPLARAFCVASAERHGFPPASLSPSVLRWLTTAEWPGNVRELAHRVEAAVIKARMRQSERVELEDLGAEERESEALTLHEATARYHRRLLKSTLDAVDWDLEEAASRLDVPVAQLSARVQLHRLRVGAGGEHPSLTPPTDAFEAAARSVLDEPIDDKLTAMRDALISQALARADGNKSEAARILGVHRKKIERALASRDDS